MKRLQQLVNNLFYYYLGGLTVSSAVIWMQGAPLGRAVFVAGAWPAQLGYVLYQVLWQGM